MRDSQAKPWGAFAAWLVRRGARLSVLEADIFRSELRWLGGVVLNAGLLLLRIELRGWR